jgi:phage tail sheath protein FI
VSITPTFPGVYIQEISSSVHTITGVATSIAAFVGMPATALEVTAADVLAWDRQRGEPPLDGGFTPEREQAVLARHDGDASQT